MGMAKSEIEFSANQREKLSKLLCNAHSISTEAACFEDATYARQLKMEADYLIANGVTIPVRCKDCKHWHEETGWCYHHSHFIGSEGEPCHPWESSDWKMLNADDFCSYGERKDNETVTECHR